MPNAIPPGTGLPRQCSYRLAMTRGMTLDIYPLSLYAQKRCFPMTTSSGRDQIHLLVAVAGLK